jgi:hypothetical protein
MPVSIDFNSIKSSLASAYRTVAATTSEWLGRAIVVIQPGTEKALPYLQDKRIAVASVVAVNLILYRVAIVFVDFVSYHFSSKYIRKCYVDTINTSLFIAALAVGVIAFSQYAKLPLSPLVIAGISLTSSCLLLIKQDYYTCNKSNCNHIEVRP